MDTKPIAAEVAQRQTRQRAHRAVAVHGAQDQRHRVAVVRRALVLLCNTGNTRQDEHARVMGRESRGCKAGDGSSCAARGALSNLKGHFTSHGAGASTGDAGRGQTSRGQRANTINCPHRCRRCRSGPGSGLRAGTAGLHTHKRKQSKPHV